MKTRLSKSLALLAASASIAAASLATSSLTLPLAGELPENKAEGAGWNETAAAVEIVQLRPESPSVAKAIEEKSKDAHAAAIPLSGYTASALFGLAILLAGGLGRRWENGGASSQAAE